MYISEGLLQIKACSFDQDNRYEVSLREMDISKAWNSITYEEFRNYLRGVCPECDKRELCMGGCDFMPEIVFCNKEIRQ